jgi:transposase
VAELSIQSVINDELWEFLGPLLPNLNSRAMLAAIVYAVTTDTPWGDLPDEFGVTPRGAERRFNAWTDADLWRQLAVAATDTPHAQWVHAVSIAAIDRAGTRARGWPDPYPKPIPPEVVDEPLGAEPAEPAPPAAELAPEPTRSDYRPDVDEYDEAQRAMNRHDGTTL